ncbi:MAG: glycosyltransferase family 9 protein [Planctomycetales bacterium]|nr:glycosyltransferase family 9 protein [Planctomycetales bacterium]
MILHPGAIGDCLLTLPLAVYMKQVFGLDRLDFVGKSEYIDFYPDRTCIDRIRSIEGIELHRLFQDRTDFFWDDKDRLCEAFAGYEQIVSFLGDGHPSFESNLLFTVHSTHSADVVVLPSAAPADYPAHITDFYCRQFQRELYLEAPESEPESGQRITPLPSDFAAGRELFECAGINPEQTIVLIHPGSGSKTKSWHWDNFHQTASELKANNVQPVFLLGPAEQERLGQPVLADLQRHELVLENLSLTQVLQTLTQADAFLGNDSGISHLSAAMGKRTVVLFGPSNPVHYRPLGPAVTLLEPSAASFAASDAAECHTVVQAMLQSL